MKPTPVDQIVSIGERNGLGPGVHAKLREDVLHVRADSLWADEEVASHLLLPEAICKQAEYLLLTAGQAGADPGDRRTSTVD